MSSGLISSRQFGLTQRRIGQSLDELASQHGEIRQAIEQVGYPESRQNPANFNTLVRIVIGQQVSTAAAASIARQLDAALDGDVSALSIAGASEATLRSAGISRQKFAYLQALSDCVLSGRLDIDALEHLDDDCVVDQITQVKGFGVWSAHMYLMFSLGRPDIWPVGDLAVRAGFGRIMKLAERPEPRTVALLGETFAPHRSALALLCWRFYSQVPL